MAITTWLNRSKKWEPAATYEAARRLSPFPDNKVIYGRHRPKRSPSSP